ncbi:MAG: CRISPR-associated endonuclease Cas1 [Acidimicrobiales bacterium]
MTDAGAAIPELVPARMVNEFTYCQRLFFLEWVQARFEHNPDTVDGLYQHRVVDAGGGRAPAPEDQSELRVARSVLVSSPELGLIGRVDLLEADEGKVVPVDYKRGSPPANEARAWEPERVQVCVLGLLLRANGYTCDAGVLWFAETRERVDVVLDDGLVAKTRRLLAELRTVATDDLPPPPLVDSPKCPRCSLVGICLPDEHNALIGRLDRPPRRLVPRDSEARPLYVTEAGATVGVRGGRIEVRKKDKELSSVRLVDVSQVAVFGNVQVTTQALRECFAREVPVCYLSYGGWLQGISLGLPSKHVELRRRQVVVAASTALEAARRMVEGKIRNCRTLLRRNGRPAPDAALITLAECAASAATATASASLLGFEGAAARVYFGALPTMLSPELSLPGMAFSFEGRNRRPPADAVNCLLSYVYSLLVKDLVATTHAVGFDPYLGIYHRPRFGRPALALDLAEEFRPLIGDSIMVNMINNGEARPSHFVVRAGGVGLTADGRKAVLGAYERRLDVEVTHPTFGYRITYRRVLEVQARLLGAWMLGEVPDYVAFTTR